MNDRDPQIDPIPDTISHDVKPLTHARVDQPLALVSIAAGRALKHRLVEMGLTPGTELCILQDNGGPIILAVRGSRLAVGRSMADRVMVRYI